MDMQQIRSRFGRGPLLALALVAGAAWTVALPAEAAEAPETIALRLLDRLDAGDFAGAEAMFSAEMAAAVPADRLEAVWTSLPAQAGPATGRGEPVVQARDGMQLATVPLHHAKVELVANIAVREDGKVAGFLIQPAPPPPADAPAPDAGYGERDFAFAGLPGTLAMPAPADGRRQVPAVVFVHGSGPQDRDETVGANRPFLDIARGLAARGVAALRYDKRTMVHPGQFSGRDYDVDDETTDDAVAAVAALRGVDGIDPDRIFVLGHSQGGMLAPRIARYSGTVAGLVLMAAPARPLLDLLMEQNRYLVGLDGTIGAPEQAHLDRLDAQITALRGAADIAPADTPLGLPAGYWRSLDAVDPVADALALDLPMLVLHGGRDFQVVEADWQRWREAFAGNPRATLKHYPALNHLGIAGHGPGSPAEYHQPGKVDAVLIDDIATWIHANAPGQEGNQP
jgi:uncharacterized protein